MFSYESLIDIRDLEIFLFEGPETVEQVYETNDNFSYNHSRRRDQKDNEDEPSEDSDNSAIWYSYYIDSKSGEIVYEFSKSD
jgi:hypothetical protein